MIEPRPRRAGVSIEVQREIAERYQRGEATRDIAAALFVHRTTVYNVLADLGVPRRPVGGSPKTLTTEQLLEVGELYALGLPQHEIAARVGVTRTTARYRLLRLGALMRSRSQSAQIAWRTRREQGR